VNRSKQKGTAAETALCRWLGIEADHVVHRNPPSGNKDIGDLTVFINPYTTADKVVVEVKNMADVARAINEGIAELDAEKANAGTSHGVLVVKRRGKGDPGEWLAIRRVCDDPEIGRP
jgi:hypothetical protein